jgi:nucleotide-binding universal stress UspA family protein
MSRTDIVVGIDGSADGERALRWAVEAAGARGTVVRAVLAWAAAGPAHDRSHPPPATSPEHPRWTARWLLDDVVDRVRADVPAARVEGRIVYGPPVQKLLAESDQAAMLVLGAHGTSRTHRMLAGSVSLACAHGATVPVVVVRGGAAGDGRGPVVVGVDGSPASRDALRWAADEARLRGASLLVVHTWEPVPAALAARTGLGDEVLRDAAGAVLDQTITDALADRAGLDLRRNLVMGAPSYGLINAAAGARLLVVGARGRGGFDDLLLGSTSSQCLLHATCPVAVVRH